MTPTKTLSIIGVLQAGTVVFGTLFVAVFLKIYGYGYETRAVWNSRSV